MIAFLRRHAAWADLAFGVAVGALAILVAATSSFTEGPLWANVLAGLAFGAALALRSRFPVAACYGFAALLVVQALLLLPPPRAIIVFFGLLAFAYTAGTSHDRVLSAGYPPVLLAVIVIVNVAFPGATVSDYVFPSAIALAAYGAGRNVVFRGRLAAELHEATLRAEEAQAAEERRAVAAERRRIAREMHDVVAHSISVMVVQAGGARRILERDRERGAAAAAAIEATGRETLLEMRRLLGVMHPGEAPAELGPTPTLSDLRALCERHGARLQVLGHAQPLPPGLEVGAYRVVQEALADVQRTTPGAHADVTVEWTPLALSLRVADDRPFIGPMLVGVRERVDLYGGSATVDARPHGHGHELHVRLPVPQGALA